MKATQHASGDAVAFTKQTKKNVFGPDIGVVELPGLFNRQRQDFFDAWRIWEVAEYLLIGADAYLLFNFDAHGVELKAELLEDDDSNALAQFDQPQQEVFGSDKIVIKP